VKIQQDRDIMALLRPLNAEEKSILRAKLKDEGCTEAFAYCEIAGVSIQLDGHHRKEICLAERIKFDWKLIEGVTTKPEAIAWVKSHQVGRRNATPEELATLREERREKVAEARQEGKSIRTIADEVGASYSTVRGDLETLTEQGRSVDPPEGKVTGKDGRERTAEPISTKPSGASTNGRRKKPEEVHKSDVQEDDAEDDSADAKMKAANTNIESFCRRLMKLVDEECPADPWLDDMGRRDAAIQKFRDACTTLRTAKCHAVCPKCEGEGCSPCRKTGRVPKATYDQLV
jgi:transposase